MLWPVVLLLSLQYFIFQMVFGLFMIRVMDMWAQFRCDFTKKCVLLEHEVSVIHLILFACVTLRKSSGIVVHIGYDIKKAVPSVAHLPVHAFYSKTFFIGYLIFFSEKFEHFVH